MYTPKYYETTLDLGIARANFRIEMLGNLVYVKRASNADANIDVRINSPANTLMNLTRHTGIICAFDSIYVSNAIQANQTLTFFMTENVNKLRYFELKTDTIISYDNPHTFPIRHAHCVVVATEYNLTFTPWARGFMLKARGGIIQFCFVALGSAVDYILLVDGESFSIDDIYLGAVYDVYFQSPTAGTVLELLEKIY